MRELVEKYDIPSSPYLLPIIKPDAMTDVRKQYLYASQNINRYLKQLGRELGFSKPLTLYVARHAWASIAKSKNIPLSVISEGMGHESEATTRIYLASLDTKAVDKANLVIVFAFYCLFFKSKSKSFFCRYKVLFFVYLCTIKHSRCNY